MNLKIGFKGLILIGAIVSLSACDHKRNHPGWEYFDDMARSDAYETYSPNSNFEDGKTLRVPVEGTIPRGFEPYPFEKDADDQILAGKTLVNPFMSSADNLQRGKKVFDVYCAMCHGDQGDGKGKLFTSGKYPFPPTDLLSEKVKNLPEGEIYHVITRGYGVMPAHGTLIRPEDRWKAVTYIQNVLQK